MTTADPRLVGREAELGSLRRAWASVRTDRPGLVLVSGEAGIGKSSLVHAFVHGLGTEADALVGQCLAFGAEAVPHAAISQILKSLVVRHGPATVRTWAGAGHDALGALVPVLGGDGRVAESERIQLFEAVADVLLSAAAGRPLVVVIEDLHWADVSTGHLLRFLDAALGYAPGGADAHPLLINGTVRGDEVSGRHPMRPVLAELSPATISRSGTLCCARSSTMNSCPVSTAGCTAAMPTCCRVSATTSRPWNASTISAPPTANPRRSSWPCVVPTNSPTPIPTVRSCTRSPSTSGTACRSRRRSSVARTSSSLEPPVPPTGSVITRRP